MYLIRSGAFEGFQKLIHKFGGNPVAIVRDTGLSVAHFRDPNSYISYPKMAELLERAAKTCNAPYLGLMLANQQSTGVFGDIVATICQEPTVLDAIKKMDRYLYLHAGGIHVSPHSVADNTEIRITFDFDSPLGLSQLRQFSVGRMISLIEWLTEYDPYSFNICLRQPRPSSSLELYSTVEFSSTFDGMRVPTKVLQNRPRMDEELRESHFNDYLGYLKSRYPNNPIDQAKELIGSLLPSGDCSLERVAASLDLHPRALQRMLKDQGTAYGMLLKEVRQSIAERHLVSQEMTITDLALNLGYVEVSVFSRHFKKWTGLSPRQWQKQHVEALPQS